MEVRINSIELASELAHSRTLYESGDICQSEDDMYQDINAEVLMYKEEIQDRFFDWYDYYLGEINKCSI
jgi:hypothetical protein